MLIEFAEENWKPAASISFARSLSPKMAFTPLWASSKLPWIPMTFTFLPFWVTICFSCTGLTPFFG